MTKFSSLSNSLYLYITIVVLSLSSKAHSAELFNNGQTTYDIVLSTDASLSEKTSAEELKDILYKISGATFPISSTTQKKPHHIFIGINDIVRSMSNDIVLPSNDESFTYRTIGENLYIYGGRQRGTMYGVYAFLEQQLGVHWYTANYTHIPKLGKWDLPTQLYRQESPAIPRRQVYYHDSSNPAWKAHNMENTGYYVNEDNKYGGGEPAIWGNHTMHKLLSPQKYFKSHPEYYSLYKGKRIENGQLCLSNKNVLREVAKNLLDSISRHPRFWAYCIGQNDNSYACECNSCKQLESQYGGKSGILIWFVNQIADNVKQKYPEKYVATFAYQYTQKPPKNIKPHDNVIIRLSTIANCFSHPIEKCQENAIFQNDYLEWSKLTQNILIWDYTTGFFQFLAPFPNFEAMGPNIDFFSRHGVMGILEEGQYLNSGGEFGELKAWLLCKLLWNPKQDVDSLAQIFIHDYYGKANEEIYKYYKLCKSLVIDNSHIKFKYFENDPILTNTFIKKAKKMLNRAELQAKDNTTIMHRVQRVSAQIAWLEVARNRTQAIANGNYKKLIDFLKREKTHVKETMSSEQYLQREGAT